MSDPLKQSDLELFPQRFSALVELLGGVEFDVIAGIDISTSTPAQGDNPLTATINQIGTAGVSKACTLRSCDVGRLQVVCNSTVSSISVYPASGDDLGTGTDTLATLSGNSWMAFVGVTSTLWCGASGTMV